MKKLFLSAVSCFALTCSCAFAMEQPEDNKLSFCAKKHTAVTVDELREYIYEGLKIAGEEVAIVEFDNFVMKLNTMFPVKEKISIKELKDKKKIAQDLTNQYIKSVSLFYVTFHNKLEADGNTPLSASDATPVMRTPNRLQNYHKHEPYFKSFQELSTQFLSIREKYMHVSLHADLETIEGTVDTEMRACLFKEESGYVPFPLNVRFSCVPVPMLYGAQLLPQKQFIFSKGQCIKDSGVILSPAGNYLKLALQYGERAEYAFTVDRRACRIPYQHDGELINSLKIQFGLEALKARPHFIPLPMTSEERDILELLFLEEIMNEEKIHNNTLPSLSQKYLTWIESEEKETSTLETKIEELKERILSAYEARTQPSTQTIESQSIKKGNKKKNKPKQNIQQKGKNNQAAQNQLKSQATSKNIQENEKKKKANDLFEKIKQEGRVKFRNILGIMNTIRKTAQNDEIFKKFATIGTGGSHINFHMEDGEGLSLVKKHGKQDVTYPANHVNYFSQRLINALFSFED